MIKGLQGNPKGGHLAALVRVPVEGQVKFKTGNLFDPDLSDSPDVCLFTANEVIKRNGELVICAGAAKAAKSSSNPGPQRCSGGFFARGLPVRRGA